MQIVEELVDEGEVDGEGVLLGLVEEEVEDGVLVGVVGAVELEVVEVADALVEEFVADLKRDRG